GVLGVPEQAAVLVGSVASARHHLDLPVGMAHADAADDRRFVTGADRVPVRPGATGVQPGVPDTEQVAVGERGPFTTGDHVDPAVVAAADHRHAVLHGGISGQAVAADEVPAVPVGAARAVLHGPVHPRAIGAAQGEHVDPAVGWIEHRNGA